MGRCSSASREQGNRSAAPVRRLDKLRGCIKTLDASVPANAPATGREHTVRTPVVGTWWRRAPLGDGNRPSQMLPTHLQPYPSPRSQCVSGNTMSTEKINLDIHKILTLLPHRYPVLLVDRVLELEPRKSIKALKNVSINEPYFMGHFPMRPVMPGVLILEALAQAAALLTFAEEKEPHDPETTLYYFVGIDKARFKRVVEPGDQLILNVNFERYMRGIWKFSARAELDGAVAAEAELMCTVKNTGADTKRCRPRRRSGRPGQTKQQNTKRGRMSKIHTPAIIEPVTKLDESNEISPYAIVGQYITISDST